MGAATEKIFSLFLSPNPGWGGEVRNGGLSRAVRRRLEKLNHAHGMLAESINTINSLHGPTTKKAQEGESYAPATCDNLAAGRMNSSQEASLSRLQSAIRRMILPPG